MSRFTDKARTKVSKLTTDEIVRIMDTQNREIQVRSSVLDSAELGYLLLSKDLLVLYVNQTLYTLADCNRKKTSGGFSLSSFIKDRKIVAYLADSVAKNSDDEYQFVRETAMYGKMDIRIYTVRTSEPFQKLFVFQDVTFLKKIREEFLKNESLAAMTTMAAGIAHEIKNPLASISIYLQLLQKKLDKDGSLDKEDASKSLAVISDEIERLNKITVDFLFAVKPVNVKSELAPVNDVVNKACNVAQPELAARITTLVRDLATSLPKAELDPNLIEQCVLNLVRNAMQAICDDREDGVITVRTYLDGDRICIAVRDNGCGMTEEQLGKIFEPYYTTKPNGTGLGLTNIFKIMKLHNGEVSVTSEAGSGSEFTLSLPVPRSERYRLGGRQ